MVLSNQTSTSNNHGFAVIELLLATAVVLVLGVAGALVYNQQHKPKSDTTANSNTTSSKDKATASTSKQAAADPYAGWKQYCSEQEKSCFKYPANWATKDVGAVDPEGDGLQITSPSGTVIWFQSTTGGFGGACDPTENPHIFINKVIAEPNLPNLYLVELGDDGTTNHIGLVNGKDGQAPTTGDTGACLYYTTFKSRHDPSVPAWFESNSNPDGSNNFKANDLSTAELILESYTY